MLNSCCCVRCNLYGMENQYPAALSCSGPFGLVAAGAVTLGFGVFKLSGTTTVQQTTASTVCWLDSLQGMHMEHAHKAQAAMAESLWLPGSFPYMPGPAVHMQQFVLFSAGASGNANWAACSSPVSLGVLAGGNYRWASCSKEGCCAPCRR